MLTAYQLQREIGHSASVTDAHVNAPNSPLSPKSNLENQLLSKEILDIACHEIRNFLYGISGMAKLLKKNNDTYEALVKNNQNIDAKLAKEMQETVNFIKVRLLVLTELAVDQKAIVTQVLNSSHAQQNKNGSHMTSEKVGQESIQLLKAKFGINGIIASLQNANATLETLLNSIAAENGFDVEVKKQMIRLLERDKRSIHLLKVCADGEEGLLSTLHTASSPKAEKLSPLMQPKKIVEEVADILKEKLDEKALTLNISAVDETMVYGNATDLRRILINLISNAIKFTSNTLTKKGQITINFLTEVNAGETILTFSVEDNGIGIKKEEQERIFKPYQQANPQISLQYGGNGLGLSSIKQLIETMHGSIECISTENVGSKFIFKLKCPTAAPASPILFSSSPTHKGKHVLIVEDNSVNRRLLQRFLQKEGYTYDIAKDGVEAVSLCESNKFDTILMDINMPVLDGLNATTKIRTLKTIEAAGNKNTPIIALSGSDSSTDLQKAISVGMNDYVVKGSSFNQQTLMEKIKKLSQKAETVPAALKLS